MKRYKNMTIIFLFLFFLYISINNSVPPITIKEFSHINFFASPHFYLEIFFSGFEYQHCINFIFAKGCRRFHWGPSSDIGDDTRSERRRPPMKLFSEN